ncbi:MAG: ATP-binding protein [Solobacterium sp.]|nr:ATP-binding protein [Solobacterium sp.]
MKIIGRKREKDALHRCLVSDRPEFAVVYGRRRIGKTYLIKEYFNGQFAFYATGLSDEKTAGQLKAFHASLSQYGCSESTVPKDWFEAFMRLRKLLEEPDVYRDPVSGKKVVFLDELPWMDTARSDFKSALEYFWNSWASSQQDIFLIVCGSATSWIIRHMLNDRKGFHNRVTMRIQLLPFTLKECEELIRSNDIVMTQQQIIECYMVFGGIPYYLNLLDSRLSLAQNIDELLFKPYGNLKDEYSELFCSLFKKPEKHVALIEAISKTKNGITRKELAEMPQIGGGSVLTVNLEELEQCGFIRKYMNYSKPQNAAYYQLVDPFVLFSLRFLKSREHNSWMEYINSPSYNAWRGNAFEICCVNHVAEIKTALGISGVETMEYAWRSENSDPGAQIDLLIDRKDGVINLCEIKFTDSPYEVTKSEFSKLSDRLSAFQAEAHPNKAIHMTVISASGLSFGKYSSVFQSEVSGEQLFA